MKAEPTRSDADEFGANAVRHLAGELDAGGAADFEASLRNDTATRSLLADLRDVDGALRAIADAESPSVHELRRTREASIRLARTQAVGLVRASTSRQASQARRIPRWPLVAAVAAVVAVVGLVGWIGSAGPVSLPARSASPDDGLVAQNDPREQWTKDLRDYGELVPAFNSSDSHLTGEPAAPDSLDDGDTQVDALTMLGTMSQD